MVLRSVVEPRDDILRQLCLMGVTLQQLFRITGINYGTINRAKSGTREPSPVNQKGAGIRQLSKLSAVGFSVTRRLKNVSNSPSP